MTAYGRTLTKVAQYHIYRADDLNTIGPSGDVIPLAAAATLLVGDLVYLSAARTVNKSTTLANHDKIIGVVIGGDSIGTNAILPDSSMVGTTAATVGQTVHVLVKGIAYVKVAAAIAAGVAIVADTTTAGRVKAATDFAVTAAGNGTLAVSAPTVGTLAIAAGGTPVTSAAANGATDIAGAPGGGVLSGAVSGGVLSGEGNNRVIGKVLDAGSGAASVVLAWINIH